MKPEEGCIDAEYLCQEKNQNQKQRERTKTKETKTRMCKDNTNKNNIEKNRRIMMQSSLRPFVVHQKIK